MRIKKRFLLFIIFLVCGILLFTTNYDEVVKQYVQNMSSIAAPAHEVTDKKSLHSVMSKAAEDIQNSVTVTLSGTYTMAEAKGDIRRWSYAPYIKGIEWPDESNTKKKITIQFKYYTAGNIHKKYILKEAVTLSEKEKKLYNEAIKLVQKVKGKNSYQKALILHDEVCKKALYQADNGSWSDQDAYNLLINGVGVCNAYADSLYLLYKLAGLEVVKVIGTANTVGSHAWNQVKIGSAWYEVDATWNDKKEGYTHEYFGITSEQMNQDHKRNDGTYKNCTATGYNYYRKTGKPGEKYAANYNALLDYLAEEKSKGSSRMRYQIFVAEGMKSQLDLTEMMTVRGKNSIRIITSDTVKNWYLVEIIFI